MEPCPSCAKNHMTAGPSGSFLVSRLKLNVAFGDFFSFFNFMSWKVAPSSTEKSIAVIPFPSSTIPSKRIVPLTKVPIV